MNENDNEVAKTDVMLPEAGENTKVLPSAGAALPASQVRVSAPLSPAFAVRQPIAA